MKLEVTLRVAKYEDFVTMDKERNLNLITHKTFFYKSISYETYNWMDLEKFKKALSNEEIYILDNLVDEEKDKGKN